MAIRTERDEEYIRFHGLRIGINAANKKIGDQERLAYIQAKLPNLSRAEASRLLSAGRQALEAGAAYEEIFGGGRLPINRIPTIDDGGMGKIVARIRVTIVNPESGETGYRDIVWNDDYAPSPDEIDALVKEFAKKWVNESPLNSGPFKVQDYKVVSVYER